MSAETIARWNSIPLSNPNESNQNSNLKTAFPSSSAFLQRTHPDEDEDDDDDDDISIVSRTPSPPPGDSMDVDPDNFSNYDRYVRGQPREIITVETKIKSSNKGFAMLAKLGWSEGQPLGLSGEGRVDPVPFQIKRDLTGLGKTNQDVRMIETTVSQRRGLDSERQQKETEDQRRAREDIVARHAALQSEISSTLAAFYCALCSKQFKNVAQYDEHTNSYAHHHKARMKDMAANAKGLKNTTDAEERMAKERKREEKELRRAAKAAGVKMVKPVTSVITPVVASGGSQEVDAKPSGFKKSGWATVSSAEAPPASQPTTSKGGWASVGSSNASSGGWASASASSTTALSEPTAPAPVSNTSFSAPSFRTAGWTSLDTGSSCTFPSARPPSPPPPLQPSGPPPPPPSGPFPPPPPPVSAHLASAQSQNSQSQGGHWGMTSVPSTFPHQQTAPRIEYPPFPPYSTAARLGSPSYPTPGPNSRLSSELPQKQPSPPRPLPATTGWQQWKSVGSGKR